MTDLHIQMSVICNEVFQSKNIDFNIEAIRSKSRVSELVRYRRIVAIALRNQHYSLSQIGGFINRNHATVLHLLYSGGWVPIDGNLTREEYHKKIVQNKIRYHQHEIKKLEEQL